MYQIVGHLRTGAEVDLFTWCGCPHQGMAKAQYETMFTEIVYVRYSYRTLDPS